MNRLQALYRHIGEGVELPSDNLQRLETSSVRTLPRFDSYVLGHFIDDLYDFKQSVYEEFRSRPDLLPAVTEGLTKGNSPFLLVSIEGEIGKLSVLTASRRKRLRLVSPCE